MLDERADRRMCRRVEGPLGCAMPSGDVVCGVDSLEFSGPPPEVDRCVRARGLRKEDTRRAPSVLDLPLRTISGDKSSVDSDRKASSRRTCLASRSTSLLLLNRSRPGIYMKISLIVPTKGCYPYCGDPNRPLRIRSLMPPLPEPAFALSDELP